MIAVTSSQHKRRSLALGLIIIQLVLSAASAAAESATKNSNVIPQVPERLRYLFDLPWCKKWNLQCIRCEKKDGQVACEKVGDNCGGFQQYYCQEYNVPDECVEWTDGCNVCERISCPPATNRCGAISCTTRGCFNPKPRFQCVKSRQK
jgi:hypothetical protein